MDQSSRCWATLRLQKNGHDIDDDTIKEALQTWWLEQQDAVPLAHVAFVNSLVSSTLFAESKTTRLPVTYEHITQKQGVDLCESVYLVFYAYSAGDSLLHVLGAYPSNLVERYTRRGCEDPLLVGDLFWTPSYGYKEALVANGFNAGSTTSHMWFHLQLEPPPIEDDMKHAPVDMDHVAYRARLMMVFWKQRANKIFLSGDGREMLLHLHSKESGYFNLTTKRGRDREHAAYWTLVFCCGHEPALWDARSYWEATLLEFRIQQYFCKERHFLLLVDKNELLGPQVRDDKGKEEADAPDEPEGDRVVIRDIQTDRTIHTRDKKLYRQRHPDGPLPTVWLAVPFATAGSTITTDPTYDVDEGHVYITYKDFSTWVGHQMEVASLLVLRHTYLARKWCVQFGDGTGETNIHHLLDVVLQPSLVVLEEMEREQREKRKVILPSGENGPSGGIDIGTPEGLIWVAMRYMPLCQARHVFFALERETHPKNNSRVSFAKFLLEAGYAQGDVDRAMFLLYGADKAYIKREHGGKWDEPTYKQTFGKQVSSMYKSVVVEKTISAYGCNSLVEAGANGAMHGCPFAKQDQGETRLLLQWIAPASSHVVQDIEDIMKPTKYPQEQCCRDFKQRRPDVNPIIVKHPNQFFRGGSSNQQQKRAKLEGGVEEIKT